MVGLVRSAVTKPPPPEPGEAESAWIRSALAEDIAFYQALVADSG
jgi:hypothetical protein